MYQYVYILGTNIESLCDWLEQKYFRMLQSVEQTPGKSDPNAAAKSFERVLNSMGKK